MAEGATSSALDEVEAQLEIRLPIELRDLLSRSDGFEGWFGATFLVVFSTGALVPVNRDIERHPGFLAFGSDGSRELIGFDLRVTPSPVVMIDITSAGWSAARFQAHSLEEFMAQRARGEDLRYS